MWTVVGGRARSQRQGVGAPGAFRAGRRAPRGPRSEGEPQGSGDTPTPGRMSGDLVRLERGMIAMTAGRDGARRYRSSRISWEWKLEAKPGHFGDGGDCRRRSHGGCRTPQRGESAGAKRETPVSYRVRTGRAVKTVEPEGLDAVQSAIREREDSMSVAMSFDPGTVNDSVVEHARVRYRDGAALRAGLEGGATGGARGQGGRLSRPVVGKGALGANAFIVESPLWPHPQCEVDDLNRIMDLAGHGVVHGARGLQAAPADARPDDGRHGRGLEPCGASTTSRGRTRSGNPSTR